MALVRDGREKTRQARTAPAVAAAVVAAAATVPCATTRALTSPAVDRVVGGDVPCVANLAAAADAGETHPNRKTIPPALELNNYLTHEI